MKMRSLSILGFSIIILAANQLSVLAQTRQPRNVEINSLATVDAPVIDNKHNLSLKIKRVYMLKRFKLFTLLCCLTAIFTLTIFSVHAQDKLTSKSKVFINGIGLVRVGMTVEQASRASGTQLIRDNYTDDSGGSNNHCFYVHPQSFSQNIELMVTNGRISRVDILGNKRITTVKGAGIGDTESRIKSLYPGQIEYSASETGVGSHLLIFTPKDRADSNYRIIFQIYKNRVSDFSAGKLPEVEYSEGCA